VSDAVRARVAKYLVRHRRSPSQSWRTFLANHVHQIMAADFFVVPTASGRLLFVPVMRAPPTAFSGTEKDIERVEQDWRVKAWFAGLKKVRDRSDDKASRNPSAKESRDD
jgi:hypothetical protein